jgi:zinc/manganese transport system substrate-binding protein
MRELPRLLAVAALSAFAPAALAALSVFATAPEWGALVQEIGGDAVKVSVATTALQDVHHVEAKPSLIARARTADLVVATGAELEAGWLPLVLRQAGNARVQPGRPGYFEASAFVALRDRPARLDRSEGDVHPGGDPHVQTDPRNILKIAAPLASRMAELDPDNAAAYRQRAAAFADRFAARIAGWERQAAPLRGVPIVVQHKAFAYLIDWLGLKEVATLEPKPGVEPTTAYLSQVLATLAVQPARMVLRAAYQSDRSSQWIAERAKIPVVTMPFTVGGTEDAKDLDSLYGATIARLLKAAS